MGRSIELSALGLYNWDDTIFDLFQIPEALDKPTLVDNLLAQTAELEVLYPNPVVMKSLIGVWSLKQLDVWNRLYETTQYEYNPIENYNRLETGSDGGTGSTTHSGSDSRSEAIMHGGTDSTTRQTAQGGSDSEQSTLQVEMGGTDSTTGTDTKGGWIAGFDSSPTSTDDGLVKKTRDQDDATTSTTYGKTESDAGYKTTNFGKTESENGSTTYGKTESISETKTYGESVATSSTGSHELHAHGNIGVTTTQKLIREQRDIEKFNLYDIIIDDFKMRFCILVY